MKLKHLAVAIAIVGFSTSALANDVNNAINLSGGTIHFGALHTDNAPFVDTFSFPNVLGDVLASASLITIGFTTEQNIDFVEILLNGVALALSGAGTLEAAFTPAELALTGPLQLVVRGLTGAAGGIFSSYAGTVNVTQVPEPGTLALLFAGLAGIQVMGRRDRRS